MPRFPFAHHSHSRYTPNLHLLSMSTSSMLSNASTTLFIPFTHSVRFCDGSIYHDFIHHTTLPLIIPSRSRRIVTHPTFLTNTLLAIFHLVSSLLTSSFLFLQSSRLRLYFCFCSYIHPSIHPSRSAYTFYILISFFLLGSCMTDSRIVYVPLYAIRCCPLLGHASAIMFMYRIHQGLREVSVLSVLHARLQSHHSCRFLVWSCAYGGTGLREGW